MPGKNEAMSGPGMPCPALRAWGAVRVAATRLLLGTGALLLAGAQGARAEEPSPVPVSAAEAAPESPRAAVTDFLVLCGEGRYAEAARYLALDERQKGRGPELARRLKAVLDRNLWVDLDALSPDPAGNVSDGLPVGIDEIGKIPGRGNPAPVRLMRAREGSSLLWAFTPETVGRVDRWYGVLGDRWLRERLPDFMFRPASLGLAWWQWAALPILLLLSWAIGRFLGWVTIRSLTRLGARTRATWDDTLIQQLAAPAVLAWTIVAAQLLSVHLDLYPPAQAVVDEALGALGFAAVFWALWRGIGVGGEAMRSASWAAGSPPAQSALSIGIRFARVAVVALGAVAALTRLGYPVGGLVAGLGLGGLAFALAAQKTVENLFGSLSLAIDAPFRVGDFVKVDDFVGTIEVLGLRSTRIRTLDRTLVTIPNGRLAEMRLESYSARDRMRLACTVGLVYATSASQMRRVLEGLEATLRAHPMIWPDAVVVRFKEFAASSLDIEIMAWFTTANWAEFQLIRQEVLLQFMEVVEGAETSFAFPTRTLHVVREAAAEAAPPAP
jgi:MscS family membrane protein